MNWLKKFSILGTVAIASLAIAQSASARFVIFVAGNDAATLQRVRTVSPAAFATKINQQPAIQAGIFNSETSADSLAIALQQSGLSAQKYFKTSGGKESNVQVPFTSTLTSIPNASALPNPQQVVIQQTPISQPAGFQPDSQPQIFSSIPQVQTQQVLVPRWQQVLVPETRQIMTQTQIAQTGYVQPQTGFIPSSTLVPTTYDNSGATTNFVVQPQPTSTAYTSNEPQLNQAVQNPNFRYIAAVPAAANNQLLLSRVRQYSPNAFLASSGRGTYIYIGAYQNRDSAESVSRYLRSQGVDSRVLYF
ncbi:MAG: hypothetical protein LH649_01645 [Pseudanabaena sp. CAN_BIN31]|nr:hypothetical protein [Pseudanabaena sp. CAN_BIN31]